MLYYSLPLFGIQFRGMAYAMTQLAARFQIWCEQFGISDEESMALWHAGSYKETTLNIGNADEVRTKVRTTATTAFNKIPKGIQVVELEEE